MKKSLAMDCIVKPRHHTLQKSALLFACALFCTGMLNAQMPPPGHEREMRQLEERRMMSVLLRDSVVVRDTVVLYDPETYAETVRIVDSKMSWNDYCLNLLGISRPESLLNGIPRTIIDPRTLEDMIIRWNSEKMKIDTIPR